MYNSLIIKWKRNLQMIFSFAEKYFIFAKDAVKVVTFFRKVKFTLGQF